MAIKRRTIDVSMELQIITGCILSKQYIQQIKDIYKPEFMQIETAPIIIGWCFDFYDQYEEAPKQHIEDIFKKWSKRNENIEQIDYIEAFLGKLSDDYENEDHFNVEFMVDKTIAKFKAESLLELSEGIKVAVTHGDGVEEAEMLLLDYKRVEKAFDASVDPFNDEDAMMNAFESGNEALFRLPGALGVLMNSQLTRDSLVGIMAPEKRGKTWWLMYIALRAYRDRCNVAIFQVGDMSQNQFLRRIGIHIAKKSDVKKYCEDLWVPVEDCENNQKNTCTKTCKIGVYIGEKIARPKELQKYKPCSKCKDKGDFIPTVWPQPVPNETPLKWREAFRYMMEYKKRVRGKQLKISTHPNSTVNIQNIKNILATWERVEDFVPDVIVIDYADILAPEIGSKEFRHQQNDTWKALRRLSQDHHCCVITATQADAASYDQKSVKRSNFSEDKRKYAHATAMYALNQTPEEKEMGIMRIAPLIVREDAYNEKHNVHMAQSLEQGQPVLFSW